MERFEEFAKDVIKKYPDKVQELLDDNDYEGEFDNKGEIPDEVVEIVWNYLSDNLNDISNDVEGGYDIEHEGGDSSIYENGIWITRLKECYGWYYWIEPEGQKYGMYPSLEESLEMSGIL